jgi:transposase
MHFRRDAHVYVGVDLHKRFHVSAVVDSYGEPFGKPLKVESSLAAYPSWVDQVKRQAKGLGLIFGLEDVHGLGRSLAQYLVSAGYTVKFANAYLTKSERDEVNKTDRHDALAIARVTAKHVLRLPDANLDPLQWALLSMVNYRKGLVAEQTRVKNRLHYLLMQAWPGWEGFFSEPFDSKTGLAFWEMYPSAGCLRGVTVEALADFLREQSHFALGRTRAELILADDPASVTEQPYQHERDAMVRQSIRQLRTLRGQLTEVREHLARLVAETDYHLTDIPGIDVVMATELIALVGDVTRFPNVDKFLAYTGIAPVTLGSGGHENRFKSQFGRRELSAQFHRIASTQLVVHKKTGAPRNPLAKAYYEKHLGDQVDLPHAKRDRKRLKKALLSLMRVQAIRFYKLMKAQKLAAEARRAQEATEPA